MKDDGINLKDVKFVDAVVDNLPNKVHLRENDILISRSGSLGLITLVDKELQKCIISSHLIRVSLKSRIDSKIINPSYVVHFLRSKFGLAQFLQKNNGAVVPEINHPALKSIKIPIPPRKIQDKIAKIMEDAYKQRKDKLKEAERLLAGINDYVLDRLGIELKPVEEKKSFVVTLDDLKDGKRHDPFYYQPKYLELERALDEGVKKDGFKLEELGDYIREIKYGASVKNDYVDAEQGIPFLRIQNITNGELDLTDLKYLNPELKKDIGKCYVKEGDVLISRSGTIGLVVYITKEVNGFAYGSYMIKFSLSNEINPKFVSILLNTSIGRLQTEQKAIGAVQKNITVPAIKSIKIPVPPIEIQNEIAEEVKRRRERAEKLRREADEVLKEAKEKVEGMILEG